MPKGPKGVEWPLVGRAEELELLREIRSHPSNAVISGPAGVGKSRLAAAALAEAEDEGWATLAIRGSAGYAAVPLGPLRTALSIAPRSAELAELTTSVEAELVALRTGKGLLVLADDAQDLDEASAALLHQMASTGAIVTIVTARSDARLPAALTALWKDGLAERIGLQNLSLRETTELLIASLGGHVQDSSANRIWQVTAGNPLYLREVVLSGIETGALTNADGEWRWRGGWAAGDRLQEIVAARLGRLDHDEAAVMEVLALARSLPLELLTDLASARAVEGLEVRALVTTEERDERLEVAIAHPLLAEVLRSQMPALRQRAIRRNLVEALQKSGSRRVEDLVRIACWSIESGLEVDPLTLALGSDASLFPIAQAIASRLSEVLPEAAISMSSRSQPVRQDIEVAVRLAQAAFDRSGGVAEGAALASALAWIGETARAEGVLAELADRAEDVDDRIRLALVLAWIRFWGRYDVDAATQGLKEALRDARGGAEPSLVAKAYEQLAGIALNTARPGEALALAEQGAEELGLELCQFMGAAPGAASLAYLGRCGEAIALVDKAVPIAHEQGHPLAVANLLFARVGALARKGELEGAIELASWLRDVALAEEMLDATAIFGVILGETLLRQGQAASAVRILRDSAGLLSERDILGYRAWALAGLARALARTGHEESAASALEEAKKVHPIGRHYDLSLYLAEAALHRLAGRTADAARIAAEAVAWARAGGMVVDEALAVDAMIRFDPSEALVERLNELAAATDSDLVQVVAEHAAALVMADADRLLAVSEQFATMTAWWMAAEAAAAAARIYERRRQDRAAKAAVRMAADFADRCEGAWTSVSETQSGPTLLTKREREVAALAATGASNRTIAENMCLSQRTVENHLYHAYVKLGVTDRASLAAALDPAN